MDENPYQPPNLTPDAIDAKNVSSLAAPRYRGNLQIIQGEIDESEAIALATACCPVDSTPNQSASRPKSRTLNLLMFVGIIAIALTLSIYGFRGTGGGASAQNGVSNVDDSVSWFWLATIIVIPLIILGTVFLIFLKLQVRFADSDPPLSGRTTVRLSPLGCSIEKTTRDGRLIEAFCSWRQVQVAHCDQAWLLSIGMVTPFLVVKSWITDDQQRSVFDSLISEISRWQSKQPPQFSLDSVPNEAGESFPDYRSGATAMKISSTTETRTRKWCAKQLRQDLSEFRTTPVSWSKRAGTAFLGFLGILTCILVLMTLRSSENGWLALVVAAPLLVVILFGFRVRFLSSRGITIDAAISRDSLWYDYRTVLLRMPLNTLPYRRHLDGNLVLATETGSTTVVLHRSYFDSEDDFVRTVDSAIADPA